MRTHAGREGGLAGKRVWITGASTGIGRELALVLARRGCLVCATARRAGLLDQLAAAGHRGRIRAVPADVADAAEMARAAARVKRLMGRVDILVANAAMYNPSNPAAFDLEDYKRHMRVNYDGVLNTVNGVIGDMAARGSGRLVIVASVVGYRGLPKGAAYGATKAALINFFESARFHLRPRGVAVTLVNPGFVETPMTAQNDFEMPFLMTAADAAERVARGIERGHDEIHFPAPFTWTLKTLRILPYPVYDWIIRRKVLGS